MKTVLAFAVAVTVPTSMVMGDVIFYDNQQSFEDAMAAAGKSLKFVETFEENNAADGGVFTLDPILTNGIPNVDKNGFGFTNGIDAPNLTVTASNESILVLLTSGFLGNTSDVVGPNFFNENGILTFNSDDKTGVGLDLWVLANNPGSMQVDVYDTAGDLIGSSVIATPGDLTYFGVQSTGAAIGSIITLDPTGGPAGELFDNVAMYTIPTPGALALLGLAGLTRRRRRFA